jgi:hypothetical protein
MKGSGNDPLAMEHHSLDPKRPPISEGVGAVADRARCAFGKIAAFRAGRPPPARGGLAQGHCARAAGGETVTHLA